MEGPRAPKREELSSLFEFLSDHLRPSTQWSIDAEYPLALSPNNLQNMRIIKEDNKIVSHALVKPTIIRTPAGLFKVASIGSVVTDTHYRNQGLSQKILDECLEIAKGQKCDFAILWTDIYDFYRKVGFELAGYEYNATIDDSFAYSDPGLTIKNTNQVDPAALLRIYSKHTVGTIRTEIDIKKSLAIPQTQLYTAWDSAGKLKAYAVTGKGADLVGYVHEWGGSVHPLMTLFSHIQKQAAKPINVIFPHHSTNLHRHFIDNNVKIHKGYLGMIKPIDLSSIIFKLIRSAKFCGVDDLVIEPYGNEFLLGIGEDTTLVPNINQLTQIIFGPADPMKLSGLTEPTRRLLERVLPLNMWIWGWDSV